jgi:hypothetical protein
MRSRKMVRSGVAVAGCLAVLCLTSAGSRAMEKTVSIMVDVNLPVSISQAWTPQQQTAVIGEVRQQLEATAADYFKEWWDIVPQCQGYPKAKLNVELTQDDWGDLFFQLRLIVDVNWVGAQVSTHTFDLAEGERWKEREVLVGLPIPPPTPENVRKGLLDFMHRSLPNDWVKKRRLLFTVIEHAPVAVDARWLDVQEKTLVLPFPDTPRYMPFSYRYFQLHCRHRYLGAPVLVARANNLRGPYDPVLVKALKATVIEPSNGWDPNDYEQAIIYLHPKDPFWETY